MPISRRNSPTRALQTTAIIGFLQGIGNFLRRPGKLNQGIARDIRHLAAFTAADHLCLPALDAGCAGTSTASATVAPRLFVDLHQAFRTGDLVTAGRLQSLASSLGAVHTSPAVTKEALALLGVPVGRCRKPVGALTTEMRRKLASTLEQLKAAGVLPGVTHGARA